MGFDPEDIEDVHEGVYPILGDPTKTFGDIHCAKCNDKMSNHRITFYEADDPDEEGLWVFICDKCDCVKYRDY